MTLKNVNKAPFPWFGGKTDAAPHVWAALGDVGHYVEPFMGSLATLLLRPHPCNRTYFSETVNDADGLLCNAWRAMQLHPDATADAASWPVCEADLHARHLAILAWKGENLERLMGSPTFCDPTIAGWWIWGQSCWIGSGWASGQGPWILSPEGVMVRREKGTREPGVSRKRPQLTGDGQGVNRPQAREPGVGDYHPMTMPEVRRWFEALSARLRHVRILNGDWSRACTSGALSVRMKQDAAAYAGVFLDPPYAGAVRAKDLYAHDDHDVAAEVLAWCKKNGADPKLRIVLAGFAAEHGALREHGWREVEWFKAGFLKGGMANTGGSNTHQQREERLWLSPACLGAPEVKRCAGQSDLFGGSAA